MSDEKPEIQLFIKSSTIDREQKGSCPLCQQWFMAACILTEQGILSFHVTIVDAESPPKEFKDLSQSKIFPVVKGIRGLNKRGQDIGDKLADDHERLEEFFESFGCPDLKRDGAVQKHFDDLYKFFNLFLQNPNDNGEKLTQKLEKLNAFLESEDERYVIKDYLTYGDCYLMPRLQHIKVGARHFNAFLQSGTDQARNRLINHLEKLNGFLEGEDQVYVTKNTITYGDCYLMPRLHHIKVAGREYADFEIPEKFFYIWRYLYQAYKTDAFQKTCPTDQDIIKHYEKKAKVFKPKKGVPSLQKSTYSFDIPESELENIENNPARGADGSAEYEDFTDANAYQSSRVIEDSHEYEPARNTYNNDAVYEDPDLTPSAPPETEAPSRTPDRSESPVRSASPAEAEQVNIGAADNEEATYEDPDEYSPASAPPPEVEHEAEVEAPPSLPEEALPPPPGEVEYTAPDDDTTPAPDYDTGSPTPDYDDTPAADYDSAAADGDVAPTEYANTSTTPGEDSTTYINTPDDGAEADTGAYVNDPTDPTDDAELATYDDTTPVISSEDRTNPADADGSRNMPEHDDSMTYENVDTSIPEPSSNTKSLDLSISAKTDDPSSEQTAEVRVNGGTNVTNGHE